MYAPSVGGEAGGRKGSNGPGDPAEQVNYNQLVVQLP
jgi:hypothetical protein